MKYRMMSAFISIIIVAGIVWGITLAYNVDVPENTISDVSEIEKDQTNFGSHSKYESSTPEQLKTGTKDSTTYSEEIFESTQPAPTPTPTPTPYIEKLPAPKGLTVSGTFSDRMDLYWNLVDGASEYIVYRSSSMDKNFEKIGKVGSSSFRDYNVRASQSYWYKIAGVDGNREGELSKPKEGTTKAKVINTAGNTVGNMTNGGFATREGDWIYFYGYYIDTNDPEPEYEWYRIYKMRTDGSDLTVVKDGDEFNYINVMDGWIYYLNSGAWSSNRIVYRIKTDESERESLFHEPRLRNLYLYKDKIYYNGTRSIYHRDIIDPGGRSSIGMGFDLGSSFVHEDWIYFPNPDSNNRLYRLYFYSPIRPNLWDDPDKYLQRITDHPVNFSSINIVNDLIYYINGNDNNIYSVKLDGTDNKKLNDIDSDELNVTKNQIYYICMDTQMLNIMDLDGKNNQIVGNESIDSIQAIVGDWIFYFDMVDDTTIMGIHIIRKDMTGKRHFFEFD